MKKAQSMQKKAIKKKAVKGKAKAIVLDKGHDDERALFDQIIDQDDANAAVQQLKGVYDRQVQ
jgi:hypothetical protein